MAFLLALGNNIMNDLETALSQIQHFQFIHEHLFSSGQPNADQLQQVKEYGVTTLINVALSNAENTLKHQDKICLDVGLNYVQMPISFDMPSVDQCILVLDMIDYLAKEQMIWIHCANNYAVSCLMYLYRQYYMNIDLPTAHETLHQVWEPNETWTGLMHAVALQLQGRKATQDLQISLMKTDHYS